jgi:hypothetical protein
MQYIDHEIRVRSLDNGLFSAVAAVRTRGSKGASLTELPKECSSGPCDSAEEARERAEMRTRDYVVRQHHTTDQIAV